MTLKRKAADLRNRKFNSETVREIRGLYNRKEMTGRAIALRHRVQPRTIMCIIHRIFYKDIK